MTRCRISHLVIDEASDGQSIALREVAGMRQLIIAIGPTEAMAIDRGLKQERFARPLTHDLILATLTALEAKAIGVRITRLEGGTYFAELEIESTDGKQFIDCRPSDAMALVARVPEMFIEISDDLLETPT